MPTSPTTELETSTLLEKLNAVSKKDKRPILVIDDLRAQVYHGNCIMMDTVLPRSKTALIITSPPYPGVDQPEPDYATFVDPKDFNSSHDFLGEVWRMCYNLLEDLGRLVVNIYDIPSGAAGMYPNVAAVIKRCLEIGFVLREEFIWAKGASYSPPSGSFPMPKGVLAANTFEMCLVFQKPLEFSQRRVDPSKIHPEVQAASKLGPAEHAWLMDPVWHISAEREGRKLGHPFTFPEELIGRLVKLYSYTNEWVFDPFLGSGTTALVAQKLGRIGIGSELSDKYIDICQKRFASGSLF